MQNTRPILCVPSAQKRAMSASLRRLVSRRAMPALAAVALLSLGAHSALADTYAFTGTGGTDPTNPTPNPSNFSLGFTDTTTSTNNVSPVSVNTTFLTFGGSTAYTANADTALIVTSMSFSNTAATSITGSQLTFNGGSRAITNTVAGAPAAVTITNAYTATTGMLASPSLNFNGVGTVTLAPTALSSIAGFVAITNGATVTTNNASTADPFGTAVIDLNGGNLSLGTLATNFTNSYVVNGTNTLTLAASNTINNSTTATLTGSGTLNVSGAQVTIYGTMSTFSGTISAPSGIRLNNTTNTNFGSSLATFDLGSGASTGTFKFRNGGGTAAAPVNLGALLGGASTSLSGQQTGTSGTAGVATFYAIGGAAANAPTPSLFTDTFNGTINNGSFTGETSNPLTNIIKTGAGSLVLTNGGSGTNGTTTISNGNLIITNATNTTATTLVSTTGAGAVAVSGGTGATLSGTGTSAGALTVTNGSVVAPGVNTTGTNFGVAGALNVGLTGGASLTNATMDYDLSAVGDTATGTTTPANVNNDTILTGGALSLGTVAINFNELTAGALDTTTPYTLISGFTSQTGFNAANLAAATSFNGGSVYTAAYNLVPVTDGTNNLTVTFAAAPEPGQTATMGLIALGLGGLFLRARKRRVSEKVAA